MTSSIPDLASDKVFKKPETVVRRTRLRDFQAQLVERMQAVRSGVDARVNQLGVLIGQNRYLLNLQEAGEIVSLGAITPVPLTQDWFLGISNIRGNLVSVIDFARFQGQPTSIIDKDCRIVVFAPGLSFNSGLLVSRIMGLRNIAEMKLQSDSKTTDMPWVTQHYVDNSSHVWHELNLSLLIQAPQFLRVGL